MTGRCDYTFTLVPGEGWIIPPHLKELRNKDFAAYADLVAILLWNARKFPEIALLIRLRLNAADGFEENPPDEVLERLEREKERRSGN